MKNVVDEIVEALEKFVSNIKVDVYNEYTRSWSKGYLKGIKDVLKIIKHFKDKEDN